MLSSSKAATAAQAALAALLCTAGLAMAGDDSISSDRPDIANSPDVVGPGRWQLEAGLGGETSRSDGSRQRLLSTPVLLRVGISDSSELRFSSNGRMQRSGTGQPTVRGWGDLGLGIKWRMAQAPEEGGLSPASALLFTVQQRTGSTAFRAAGSRPELDIALSWELPQGLDLSVMPGLYRDRNDQGESYTGGILAISLGRAFNERWHGFVEVAGQQLARRRDGGNVLTVDFGASYLVSPDLQLDFALFRGLNRQSPDWQWTTGLSRRF